MGMNMSQYSSHIDAIEFTVDPDGEVEELDSRRIDEEIAEHLMANPGPPLSVDEINDAIEDILGTDVTLQAVERDGHILLVDGELEEVNGDDVSRKELVLLCYEWAVCVGYVSEDLRDFIEG